MATTSATSILFSNIKSRNEFLKETSQSGIVHLDDRAIYQLRVIEENGQKYSEVTKELFIPRDSHEKRYFPAFQVESQDGGRTTIAVSTLRNKEELDAYGQMVSCTAPATALFNFECNTPLDKIVEKIDSICSQGVYFHVKRVPIVRQGKYGTYTSKLTIVWVSKS